MKILGIIPARYGSSRFPGKPLVMISGKSMIRRVYEQALQCRELSSVIIATDSKVIEKHVRSFDGNVMMTSSSHKSGTERCCEVLEKLEAAGAGPFDIVINIQGDEPFIDPRQISSLAEPFKNKNVCIATLVKKINTEEELRDPNVVKVVFDRSSTALYFSRQPVPFFREKPQNEWLKERDYFKHVGIYAYRAKVLKEIVALPLSSLEKAESLEQLRWMDNGYELHVHETEFETIAIDTPADLLKITNIP